MPSASYEGAHISSRCYINKVISTLDETLDDDNKLSFKSQSCFGHLWDFPPNKFLAQLTCHCLQVMKLGYHKTAVFGIGKRNMHLSAQDFYLIIGLSFTGNSELPPRSHINDLFFGGSDVVYLHNVESVYKSVAENSNGRGDMTLKLALLWFLYAVLFGKSQSNSKINVKYMHLIDDLDKFNDYPWGLECYKFFIQKLCRTRQLMEVNSQEHLHLEMYGLTYVLQVWFFEAYPSLGAFCAKHVNYEGNSTARILRWSVDTFRRYSTLNRFFVGPSAMQLEAIVPREAESLNLLKQINFFPIQTETYKEIEDIAGGTVSDTCTIGQGSGGSKKSKYNLRSSGLASGMGKMDVEEAVEGASKQATHKHMLQYGGDVDVTKMLCEMRGNLDILLEFVVKSKRFKTGSTSNSDLNVVSGVKDEHAIGTRDLLRNNLVKGGEAISCHAVGGFYDDPFLDSPYNCKTTKNISTFFSSSWIDDVKEFIDVDIDKARKGDTPSNPLNINEASDVSSDLFEKMKKGTGKVSKCIDFSQELHTPCILDKPNLSASYLAMHDPFASGSEISLSLFKDLVDGGLTRRRNGKLTLNMAGGIDIPFFMLGKLHNRNGWLNNTVCDVILLALVNKRMRNRDLFLKNWTIVDSVCSSRMVTNMYHESLKTLEPYVNGAMPVDYPVKWIDADHIYGLCWVLDCHWVAYDIQTNMHKIVVYDSMSKSNNTEAVRKKMDMLRRFVQFQMNQTPIKAASTRPPNKANWELIMFNHPPQQLNTDDCGVMGLKFIECLATGSPIEMIDPKETGKYRDAYCSMIAELSMEYISCEDFY